MPVPPDGRTLVAMGDHLHVDVRRFAVVRELLLVAAAAVAYGGVRALTEGDLETAMDNGRAIANLELTLGLAWEHATQSLVLPHAALVTLVNWIYIFGHWPVIVVSAIWLYRTRRPAYRRLRNAILLSGAVGFLFFALLPVAPPRLLELGLADTVADRSTAYRALQPPALTNQVAAMPSLHFGWNLLVGVVVFTAATSLAARAFAVAMPPAMAFAIVATGNHFVLDAFVGMTLVLLSLAVVIALEHRPTLDGDLRDLRRRTSLWQRPRHAPLGRR
ncbi:MAG: phosphatase PAP2 family protein [Pseudomonadota bacterium]